MSTPPKGTILMVSGCFQSQDAETDFTMPGKY
jgi:hypothetical protein